MPVKTDSILANLPYSFRPATRSSALTAIAGAVGAELQKGELALARIMRSHWVDTADQNAKEIDDLARLGSLWGLAPLRDNDQRSLESVEQFRNHLKHYVQTLLEGTVTVQGILRLASDILGISVDISGDEFDPWWTRKTQLLVSAMPRGEDASSLVLGVPFLSALGVDAQPARVRGTVDLRFGIKLGKQSTLRLKIDDHGPHDIDLSGGKEIVGLPEIVKAINDAFPAVVASDDGEHLIVESITQGPHGRIEIEDRDNGDAAFAVLGTPAMIYTGQDATGAHVKSPLDLSAGRDLSQRRFLRLVVDGKDVAEIDCAGTDPKATLLEEIKVKVNQAFGGKSIASHDGQFLSLASPTKGASSSIFLQEPAAQNCADTILGTPRGFILGTDAETAAARGLADLSAGVDLSEQSLVKLRVDTSPSVIINCSGADPKATTIEEILKALNSALGPGSASTDGRTITLQSGVAGLQGQIVFEDAGENDALRRIFGFAPRVFHGVAALPGSITSTLDISGGIDVSAQHLIGISVDHGPVQEIELRSPSYLKRFDDWVACKISPEDPLHPCGDAPTATPEDIRDAINASIPGLSFTDGRHMLFTSPVVGAASHVAIVALESVRRRIFTTRAMILDEASQKALGFTARRATGSAATNARVIGKSDLSFGVDLRQDHWLNISIDGAPPKLFDCAGPRPRATTLDEILSKVPAELKSRVASDGKHLIIFSDSTGAGSSIQFHPVTALDAAETLFGKKSPYGESRGTDAGRVVFVGTVDLSKGVELAPDAHVKIGIDDLAPVEIPLNPSTVATSRSAGEIAAAINFALNATIASHDGRRLTLTSRRTGTASRLEFEPASGTDAAKAVFGIEAPRIYQSDDATHAVLLAPEDQKIDKADLSVRRFLNVSVDGAPPKAIDCTVASQDPGKATLKEIVNSLNRGINGIASVFDDRVQLHCPTSGSSSRLAVTPFVGGDARSILLGGFPDVTRGLDPQPAQIVGDVVLLRTVDLQEHRRILLSVDGSHPIEVDISGDSPAKTNGAEIVDAINRQAPGIASLTPDGKLALTSPTAGEQSLIEIVPRRFLELIEYPPEPRSLDIGVVRHGQQFSVRNAGASATTLRITIDSTCGVVSPALVNHSIGMAISFSLVIRAGDRLVIEQDPATGLRAHIESPLAEPFTIPSSDIQINRLQGQPLFASPLEMPRGSTNWTFLESTGARFNEARFETDSFASLPSPSLGIFDISLLNGTTSGEASIFWPPPPPPEPNVRLSFDWIEYRNGSFEMNLPSELPRVFGGHFNDARFGLGKKKETFPRVVFEPQDDPDYVFDRLNAEKTGSHLIEVDDVLNNPDIGFTVQTVPFREPRNLKFGDARHPARIFLAEEGSDNLIELKAREPGEWGNDISVVVRPDGPARYQIELYYEGERFEGARGLILGGTDALPPSPGAADLPACAPKPPAFASLPAPGLLQGKAAGVRARVTRDLTEG